MPFSSLGVDNAAAGVHRGVVAEVVGSFQHEPGGVYRGLVRSCAAEIGGAGIGGILLANGGAELR
ncbi:hypothetical protein ABH995_005042 [Bradyrhizobium yuanmingense]